MKNFEQFYDTEKTLDRMVSICDRFAENAHKGQTRFGGNIEYITHPRAVANSLSDPIMKSVALLHDVLEDTNKTEENMRKAGISSEIIRYCKILNKNNYNSYPEYIKETKKYPITKMVKIKDIEHNSSDKPTKNMKKKYAASLDFLRDKISYDEFVSRYNEIYNK